VVRENELRYRTFFENLYESVSVLYAVRDAGGAVIDGSTTTSTRSRSCCSGATREEVIGKCVRRACRTRDSSGSTGNGSRARLATGAPSITETVFKEQHFLVSTFRINEDCVASVGLDITDRKRIEDVLKREKVITEQLVFERTRELISAQLELQQSRRLTDIRHAGRDRRPRAAQPARRDKPRGFQYQEKIPGPGAGQPTCANIEIRSGRATRSSTTFCSTRGSSAPP